MSLAESFAGTRRLAAILAADVAGYSRLMGADEEGTLARLKSHRRELIDPKIREHRGRIVKTTGDGMLVEFASVVDAVRCAVEVQRGMLDREAEIEESRRIRFRVGINLGDIIADDGDIFGDGVNVAARLEGLAEPGGVCISGTVRDHIGDRLPYEFADLGEQIVKNIARAVRAHTLCAAAVAATPSAPVQSAAAATPRRARFHAALAGIILVVTSGIGLCVWWLWPQTAPSPTTQLASLPRLSVVVLPFTNLSNDPEQEHFADAVTDSLTTDLTRVPGSFVIARNTASSFKGKAVDVKQIGHDLGVRYVLEGSVGKVGEQFQVNVQLIDADTGAHEWADRFDTDLATAQRNISARLASMLKVELLAAVDRQIEATNPSNLDPRDLILQGWARWYRPETRAQLQEMRRIFERVSELDPESVEARVGIATAMVETVIDGWSNSREQDLEQAERLLAEALERDRKHVQLHFAMGLLRRLQARFADSKLEFERTAALDPNFAGAQLQLGFALIYLGQPEAALPHFETGSN
jgi:adenylate cyclase